jgi:streptomycin 3"-adenylyltransferase
MFGNVPEEYYLDSILGDVSDAENEITDNPMYMILNLTRVLGYLREKKILSKKEGGIWGLKNLPERYHPLIHSALDEYESGKETSYDSARAKEYANYMLGMIASGRVI